MNNFYLMKCCATIFFILSVSGCTSEPFHYENPRQREQALSAVTQWHAVGALSILFNNQRDMMAFDWSQQTREAFNITLSAFTYRAQVQYDGNLFTLKTPQTMVRSQSLDELTLHQFGWSAPITACVYWLRGVPEPSKPFAARYDQYGHLSQLNQAGWVIQYTQYKTIAHHDVPTRFVATNADVELRMVIRHWGVVAEKKVAMPADQATLLLRSV